MISHSGPASDPIRLSIDRTFNGPADSAHGGYACARFARGCGLPPPLAVTLLVPPPLDSAIEIFPGTTRCTVRADGQLIATVATLPKGVGGPVAAVDLRTAEAAAEHFSNADHPFPTCFVCGHGRSGGSGLRLRPGALAERPDTVACPWTPAAELGDPVPEEFVWSALDCPGGWAGTSSPVRAVLTRMSAEIAGPVRAGRRHAVVGAVVRRHGRTRTVATALYTDTLQLVAKATATWTDFPDHTGH
ncbi:hypothetical protein GZH49_06055 [Nocardia terpenica]|uniref:hypothetical protein n=1 Tax=Nocardia terpenica TaxID=455432 RepID=UPI002FE23F86